MKTRKELIIINLDETVKIILKGTSNHSSYKEIVHKITTAKNEKRPLRIKLGLDPSSPDIHLGHSVILRKIRQLQDLGHQAIIIIGDFTGMIGDPTGKSKTRKQLNLKQVNENANTYKEQIFKIINPKQTIVKYNSEWLSKVSLKDIITLSSRCTVAKMLARDDFKSRYVNKQPISLHEFFYPLMQAYDSVIVKADIELGGTDQAFNVLMGRDMQKYYNQEPQLTLFMPILEGLDGVNKMSKSLKNYIGINENADIMYEKIMKIPDNLIIKYYELCTGLCSEKLETIKQKLNSGENPRDIKMGLAREITKLYHSPENVIKAENRFKDLFQKKQIPQDILEVEYDNKKSNIVSELLTAIVSTGKYTSNSDLRRLFKQNAVKVLGEKIQSPEELLKYGDEIVVQIGKRNFFKLMQKKRKS